MNVYQKTEKGLNEIATRAHRLPPRLRQALILVDGRRDDVALSSLIPGAAAEVLDSLLSEGFIAVSQEVRAVAERPTAVSPTPKAHSFETLRRDAVRALNDMLGPMAETACMRIEKAKSMADLGPAIGQAVQFVRMARGDAAADDFASRFVA
jgi:hypothetical protein